jgi:hypothetical protein
MPHQQIIKEAQEQLSVLVTDTQPLSILDARAILETACLAVRKQTLEDVRAGVPGEQDTDSATCDHNQVYRFGHNQCRTAVLEHMEGLLGKE